MIGKITAIRALVGLQRAKDYLLGKIVKVPSAELAGSPNAISQTKLAQDYDISAAKSRRSPEELEHADMFCAARELRYAHQSRRDIYRRASQERLRADYELWMMFVRENSRYDCARLPSKDPNKLLDLSLAEFQNGKA